MGVDPSMAVNGCGGTNQHATLAPLDRPRATPVPPAIPNPQTDTIIFGFDSAWSDKSPGAICALAFDQEAKVTFHAPKALRFVGVLDYIRARRQSHACAVVALDQPTIVPNKTGMRPAERVAGALLGQAGGVQPANRSKKNMFGDHASIWDFKNVLCSAPERFTRDDLSPGRRLNTIAALSGEG